MIRAYIRENENNEEIEISSNAITDDIYKKIFRTYKYILTYNYQVVERGKLISEYNIVNGANLYLFRYITKKILLKVKTGSFDYKIIEVFIDDPLFVLLKKLNISNKNTNFILNGTLYSLSSIQTFDEIGIRKDTEIAIDNCASPGFVAMENYNYNYSYH
jgi:hypothetical protein